MKKKTLLILTIVAALGPNAHSQWLVEDASVLAQTVLNVALGRDQVTLSGQIVDRIGDASSFKQIPGLPEVLQSLGAAAATSCSVAGTQAWTGMGAMTYSGGDIYHVVGQTIPTPDGTAVERNAQDYKKFEAAHTTASQYLTVVRDTEPRRKALLQGMKATTAAIQNAKDLSEVQKLQAVASAESAAINAIDGERSAALGTALVQSVDNSTDASRQAQARKEERAADFNVALAKADRFLTPVASKVTIPDSRGLRR